MLLIPIETLRYERDCLREAREAHFILRACLHGVGDPGLVGLVSFVLTLW